MKKLLIQNRYFLLPFLLFLVVSAVLMVSFSKTNLFILINQAHSPFFDPFFKYVTHLGDRMATVILAAILLLVKYRYAAAFLTGSIFTSGTIHLFKKVIFPEMQRPSAYFEQVNNYQVHLVDGVDLLKMESFPSGHSGTAFNIFLMLALLSKNHSLKLAFFLMALVVAWSRVYISQHFLTDITVGSLISVIFMFFSYYWVKKWNMPWLDKSLINKS